MEDGSKGKHIKKKDNRPLPRWLAIGIAIGAGIGVAMDNIPVGIAVGVAIGVGIGSARKKKQEDQTQN